MIASARAHANGGERQNESAFAPNCTRKLFAINCRCTIKCATIFVFYENVAEIGVEK